MLENGILQMVQADGALPAVLASGSAPGESGVSIFRTFFREGVRGTLAPAWFQSGLAGQLRGSPTLLQTLPESYL